MQKRITKIRIKISIFEYLLLSKSKMEVFLYGSSRIFGVRTPSDPCDL